jgi:hypothetical protein
MKQITACCELSCHDCEAFVARSTGDCEKMKDVADGWSKILKMALKPEDIRCDGCKTDSGSRFRYCASCGIRRCAREKSVSTCADCGEYVCKKLEEFFHMVPASKKRLEAIRLRNH